MAETYTDIKDKVYSELKAEKSKIAAEAAEMIEQKRVKEIKLNCEDNTFVIRYSVWGKPCTQKIVDWLPNYIKRKFGYRFWMHKE
jgi:hypothetical protein